MVWLYASDTALLVTADHRIVVPRGHGVHQQLQSIPANHLRVGDVVLCADGEQILSAVEFMCLNIGVYHLAFKPDIPIVIMGATQMLSLYPVSLYTSLASSSMRG